MPDFVFRARCGCRVVYPAASHYLSSHQVSCTGHAKRIGKSIWRDVLSYQADQAFNEWELAGRPEQAEEIVAA